MQPTKNSFSRTEIKQFKEICRCLILKEICNLKYAQTLESKTKYYNTFIIYYTHINNINS